MKLCWLLYLSTMLCNQLVSNKTQIIGTKPHLLSCSSWICVLSECASNAFQIEGAGSPKAMLITQIVIVNDILRALNSTNLVLENIGCVYHLLLGKSYP